jgi:putative transcriptional regulator
MLTTKIPKAPYLLIAMPQLQDPHFDQTVILIVEHTSTGALGVVVNDQSPQTIADVEFQEVKIHPSFYPSPIWVGGPCEQDRFWMLHKTSDRTHTPEISLGEGVGISSSFKDLEMDREVASLRSGNFKMISGYAGWASGQLEAEIRVAAWLTVPFQTELIFDTPPQKVWGAAIKELGFDPSQLVTTSSEAVH